jgi:hypothetical protein
MPYDYTGFALEDFTFGADDLGHVRVTHHCGASEPVTHLGLAMRWAVQHRCEPKESNEHEH